MKIALIAALFFNALWALSVRAEEPAFMTSEKQQQGAKAFETTPSNEAIFTDILQTLSPQLKARLDSTHQKRTVENFKSDSLTIQKRRDASVTTPKTDLKALPDDVRARVEKNIAKLTQQHQQRVIEFKEKIPQKH
jgi:ATP/maltotriose-dependent transcriptional regulator MalT